MTDAQEIKKYHLGQLVQFVDDNLNDRFNYYPNVLLDRIYTSEIVSGGKDENQIQELTDLIPLQEKIVIGKEAKSAEGIYEEKKANGTSLKIPFNGIAIGEGSTAAGGVAIGPGAEATNLGGAVGCYSWAGTGFAGGKKAQSFFGGAVGEEAKSTFGGAVGLAANTTYGGAVGHNAKSDDGFAGGSQANTEDGGAVGYQAKSTTGFAGGYGAKTSQGGAIGEGAIVGEIKTDGQGNTIFENSTGGAIGLQASATTGFSGGAKAKAIKDGAVQLGEGTNESKNTLQFRDYQLVDANGHIPVARLGTIMEDYYNTKIYYGTKSVGENWENKPKEPVNGMIYFQITT